MCNAGSSSSEKYTNIENKVYPTAATTLDLLWTSGWEPTLRRQIEQLKKAYAWKNLDIAYPALQNVIWIWQIWCDLHAYIGIRFGFMVLLCVKKMTFCKLLWIFSSFGTTDFFYCKDFWQTDKWLLSLGWSSLSQLRLQSSTCGLVYCICTQHAALRIFCPKCRANRVCACTSLPFQLACETLEVRKRKGAQENTLVLSTHAVSTYF